MDMHLYSTGATNCSRLQQHTVEPWVTGRQPNMSRFNIDHSVHLRTHITAFVMTNGRSKDLRGGWLVEFALLQNRIPSHPTSHPCGGLYCRYVRLILRA